VNDEGPTDGAVMVRGRVAFPLGDRPAPPYTVVVRVEDVSRADAPSTIVGESRLENPTLPPGPQPELDFAVSVPTAALGGTARLNVRVHVHPSRPGERRRAEAIDIGDLVSTQSHPVAPGSGLIRVPLQRV